MSQLKELTWSQAIEKAIIQLGYIATLKQIYQIAPTFKTFSGLTPHKTINERVQRDDNFVKLKAGLYGLKNHLDKLPDEYNPNYNRQNKKSKKLKQKVQKNKAVQEKWIAFFINI